MIFITVFNGSCGKVMFSQTSVCPQLGGCVRGLLECIVVQYLFIFNFTVNVKNFTS